MLQFYQIPCRGPARAPWLLCIAGLLGPAVAQAEDAALAEVTVVGATPLPGLGLSRAQVAAPVVSRNAAALQHSQRATLGEFLERELGSVHINDMQGNALQADVNYRGYTASPLLGTPQGLSVYLDGMRMNQPFGDVVSWDALPRSALATLTLMPGSNPLFGLNTLGGALALTTKDGLSHPGTAIETGYGSDQRRRLGFEHGGSAANGLNWFVTGNWMKENGWREHSPSETRQLFAKLGWSGERTDLAAALGWADNTLTGNGLQDARLLARDYRSVYTQPDETDNRSAWLNLTGKHQLNDRVQLAGNAYARRLSSSTLNGDLNEDSLDQQVYLLRTSTADRNALSKAGYSNLPSQNETAANTPFPYWRCLAQTALADEPAEKCNGLLNRTRTRQTQYGFSGQFTLQDTGNQFTAGLGYDASRVRFSQTSQFGYLNPDRSVTPVNFFADGTEIDDSGVPVDSRVKLSGRTRTWSLFATDTLTLAEHWHLTLSARWNQTRLSVRDHITPGGGAGSMDGDHRFSRVNPAAGLSYAPSANLTAWLGYNQGSRAPSVVELGCADPSNPCRLPNAMASDPALRQVVTHTWEAGVRGKFTPNLRWQLGGFRADSRDDILFVASRQSGSGYFKNVDRTRRQGVELGLSGEHGAFNWGLDYTYLDATYQSAETLTAAANSSQDASGNIRVQPGDRLPLTPRHLVKLRADYRFSPQWQAGVAMRAVAGSLARGNENGQHQSDGVYNLGPGRSAGYAVWDLTGEYRPTAQLTVFGQVNNVFDRRYATAAQLGATGFTSDGNFVARPFAAVGGKYPLMHATFYAPGAPRSFWLGVRYEFDKVAQKD
ncbi:TonB-dependent receptor [Rivihabitans pingtungensis]|uniref:TonB-dependent receptor n=1 Tax=Rivihabitans pingtungensis TaxID=1054498 RepID=UPI0023F2A4C8|nr:TonB-dependent receptor [Rivihabitans pingtungensis]